MFEFPPLENHLNPHHYYKDSLIDYVIDQMRKAKNLTPPDYDISTKDGNAIVLTCYGIRCWIETERGSAWLYSLTGLEELQPHVGYNYVLVTPQPDGPSARRTLSPTMGYENLVAYTVNPIDRKTDIPKSALVAIKEELYKQGESMVKIPELPFIDFVFRHARDWFSGPNGYQWCTTQVGHGSRLAVFHAIDRYGARAYKITERGQNPFWAGPRIETLAQVQWVEHEPKALGVCEMCDQEFPCIQITRHESLCCHCLSQTSKDATAVLDFCAYSECRVHGPCKNYTPLIQVRSLQEKWRESLDVNYAR